MLGLCKNELQIKIILSNAEKEIIARTILELLPAWFGIPESTEEYIMDSKGRPFFCAYADDAPIGFLYLKETGRHTVELAVMGVLKEYHRQEMIGYILFNEMDEGIYELGWFFNRSFWRQGYASESCKAVIDYAFGELKAHKVFAETIDAVKSVGLMKKLGMRLESIQTHQTEDTRGNWTDLYFYSLNSEKRREEYESHCIEYK